LNNVVCIKVDVTKQSDVDEAVAVVRSHKKPLYGIINCAGIVIPPGMSPYIIKGISECSADEVMRPIFEVNLFGTCRMNSAFLPLLLESGGGGVITNIASVAGRVGLKTMFGGSYSASKWGKI
jgi:NAD(P)-dependent dehydrogenase (short-subunit alcohol dehydrogenase family)